MVERAIVHIEPDYIKVPYLYVDICKYGIGTTNVHTWIDENEEMINGVYLLYFDCLHFFTKDPLKYKINTFTKIVNTLKPRVIMVQGEFGDRIEKKLINYYVERNKILDMSLVYEEDIKDCYLAKKEDIKEIVDLLMNEAIYTEVFDENTLLKQMEERFEDKFSRYFVIKDNNKIIATCSTYGETENIALIGSVMVHPDYRRRGLASTIEKYACTIMKKECKKSIGFVNYNNTASIKLHESIGCKSVSNLYKFVAKY